MLRKFLEETAQDVTIVDETYGYRYFDARDQTGNQGNELDDGLPHNDCNYFAVYDRSEPFDKEALDPYSIVSIDRKEPVT